jgi:hypothetical protein
MRFLTLPDLNASSGLQALPTLDASTDSTCKGTLLWKVGHEERFGFVSINCRIVVGTAHGGWPQELMMTRRARKILG